MKTRFDHLLIGAALGLVAPVIVLLIFYVIRYSHISFGRFLQMVNMEGTFSPRISLCVIVNLLIFYLFIWTNRYYSARGVILATFVYAGLVIYLKVL
ncbi:MAG TPA: hypothetical protein VI112_11835 [Bacteroidia bacterium]|jgi:hypothetical protein